MVNSKSQIDKFELQQFARATLKLLSSTKYVMYYNQFNKMLFVFQLVYLKNTNELFFKDDFEVKSDKIYYSKCDIFLLLLEQLELVEKKNDNIGDYYIATKVMSDSEYNLNVLNALDMVVKRFDDNTINVNSILNIVLSKKTQKINFYELLQEVDF